VSFFLLTLLQSNINKVYINHIFNIYSSSVLAIDSTD